MFGRNKDVFISHSSKNKDIVDYFVVFLKSIGLKDSQFFCSSVVGQGINNGEKLNAAICKSIKQSRILVYLISKDFMDSSYCMEELGVGWYCSENSSTKCYFLVLPDVFSISELQGFVNSKIDKFSFVDENKKDELGLLAENLCNGLGMKIPSHSSLTNAINLFYNATKPFLEEIVEIRKKIEKDKKDREEEIKHIIEANRQLNAISSRLSQQLEDKRIQIENERNQHKIDILAKEYHTIQADYSHFGTLGITKERYSRVSEHVWFSMISRYLGLRKELEKTGYPRLFHSDIEILIATIYSAHGDLEESYEFLKNYFTHVTGTIYPNIFNNIVFADNNDTHELIDTLRKKIELTEKGVIQDSYKESLSFLLKRKKQLEEGADNA